MAIGKKSDFPPLLAPGRHAMTLETIKRLFVEPFPSNRKRQALFQALEEFAHNYFVARIPCEVWIDGSFLTEKPEPDDIDVAVIVSHEVGLNLNEDQKYLIEDTDLPEKRNGIDSFSFVRLSKDDPFYGDDLLDGGHTWSEQWSIEHSGQWLKGFAVLKIGETDVGLRICS